VVAAIPWEIFRPLLEPGHERERKSNAGRKPFDVVLMFKLLILQTLYNLADEQVEYQIRDRLSLHKDTLKNSRCLCRTRKPRYVRVRNSMIIKVFEKRDL